MLESLLGSATKPVVYIEPGQIDWDVPGTYQWKVPEGVTEVSAVVLGGGGTLIDDPNRKYYAGDGGSLVYMNKIPTVPGSVMTVVVAALNGQSKFANLIAGMYNNKSVPSGAVGWDGGVHYVPTVSSTVKYGAGAASFTAAGAVGAGGSENQPSSYPAGWDRKFTSFSRGTSLANPRLGVGASRLRNNLQSGPAGNGAVRIIWGTGRAFPATRIADE